MPRSRSHVFLARDRKILVLKQASGAWWELPGGELTAGEDPAAAAIRETAEETGLVIAEPELLRRWTYRNRRDEEIRCYAYAAHAPDGDACLSEEHAAYEWMTADSYAVRFCGESIAAVAPEWARIFLAEMRTNCSLFDEWLARKAKS